MVLGLWGRYILEGVCVCMCVQVYVCAWVRMYFNMLEIITRTGILSELQAIRQ